MNDKNKITLVTLFIFGIPLMLPVLWAIGVHVNDIALAVVFAGFIYKVSSRLFETEVSALRVNPFYFAAVTWSFSAFLVSFSLYVFIEPWLKAKLGLQGSEFIVFSQVVDSISRGRGPLTTAILDGLKWSNFLEHHWSPFFYFPGIFSRASGLMAFESLALFHGINFITTLSFFYLFCRAMSLSKRESFVVVGVFAMNPAFRHIAFHSLHDEVFASSFLALAFLGYAKGYRIVIFVGLFFASLCKENLFAISSSILVFFAMTDYMRRKSTATNLSQQKFPEHHLFYSLSAFFFALAFFVYFFGQPIIFQKSFDHLNKVASTAHLINPTVLLEKIIYIFWLFLPFLPWFLLMGSWKWICLIAIASTPQIAMIMIANFPEMWKPLNYYSMIPTVVTAFSLVMFISTSREKKTKLLDPFVLTISIGLAFVQSTYKPLRTILEVRGSELMNFSELQQFKETDRVIATPAPSLYLFHTETLWQLDAVNKNPNVDFNYVITKKSEVGAISPQIMAQSYECMQNPYWNIRCRNKIP